MSTWQPASTIDGGTPDYTSIPPADQIIEAGEPWVGISEPDGGILNLTILKEIDHKAKLVEEASVGTIAETIGQRSYWASNNGRHVTRRYLPWLHEQYLHSHPTWPLSLGVPTPAPTNWTDCFPLDCLSFDDENITQAHIDMAAARMAEGSNNDFLRWISLDGGFV